MNLKISILTVLVFIFLASCSNQSNTAQETKATPPETTTTAPTTTPTAMDGATKTVVLDASKASPRKELTGMVGDAKVTVNYSSPSVKGRKIYGELVPYGKVWRTGADGATTIEFSKDVMVEGQKLAAGKYGLFTVPSATQWTIVFNKTHDQWGAYEYDESKDVLRVDVAPKMEMLIAEMMDFELRDGVLLLKWDKTVVPIKLGS